MGVKAILDKLIRRGAADTGHKAVKTEDRETYKPDGAHNGARGMAPDGANDGARGMAPDGVYDGARGIDSEGVYNGAPEGSYDGARGMAPDGVYDGAHDCTDGAPGFAPDCTCEGASGVAFDSADANHGVADCALNARGDACEGGERAQDAGIMFEADEIIAADPKPRFDDFDFSDFWHDTKESERRYTCPPPDRHCIRDTERELGYSLPASYIELMKKHNGGLLARCWHPINRPAKRYADFVQITSLFGIGKAAPYSLCGRFGSRFMLESRGYAPKRFVAIGTTGMPGRLLLLLDYGLCGANGEPDVILADRETGEKRPLAKDFETFVRGLRAELPARQI